MGSSSYSGKGKIPKNIKINDNSDGLGGPGGVSMPDIADGESLLDSKELQSAVTLDQLFEIIEDAISKDQISPDLKNKQLVLPTATIKNFSKKINHKNNLTGKLIGKISKVKKGTGSGASSMGGLPGGLSLLSKITIEELEDVSKDLELTKQDKEILKPSIIESNRIKELVELNEVDSHIFDKSEIALLAAIKYKVMQNSLEKIDTTLHSETKKQFVREALNELKRKINIHPENFEKKSLSNFLGANNE